MKLVKYKVVCRVMMLGIFVVSSLLIACSNTQPVKHSRTYSMQQQVRHSSALPTASKKFHSNFKEIAFIHNLPRVGNYNMRAQVADVNLCARGSQCLVADQISIITPQPTQPYAQSRAVILYPDNVAQFIRGRVYLFSFSNGYYLGSQLQ